MGPVKRSLVVACFLLAPAGCGRSPSDTSAAQAEAPAALEVVPVVARKLETSISLPAELTAYESVAIYPRLPGFVEEVVVDRGSKVRKGELLARLSAPELAAQRAEAESKAVAAKSTFERLRAADRTPGAVAHHELEVAEAGAQADESRVKSLRTLEGYLTVRAPFDGIVTERNVHPGALVGPPSGAAGTPMLRVEQVAKLRLVVAVPESDVGAVSEGAEATFSVRAWPGQSRTGVVRRVAHSIDSRTRTMAVELDIDNGDGKLAPGMFAQVKWPVRRSGPSLLVPASAVAQTTEKTFVDRVRDGIIDQVPVQRGATEGELVEVFGPLAAGELVLRRGSEELRNGARVTSRPARPEMKP
jgi:membrane fusion protein (multidrug efflux system)